MRKYIGHERLLIVGASVFVFKDGKLLLQKRRDNGCWADHGGCNELGETVEETARRELYEETGLTANSLELLGIFSGKELNYTYPNGDKVSNVNIAYLCEDFSGNLLTQSNETTDLRWFGPDELPENISPPVKPALARCLELLKNKAEKPYAFDMKQTQARIYQNKIAKGFNVTDIYREFCYISGELAEACEAYMQKKDDLGEELADVAIYLLGLAEILGVDLEKEIVRKMDKNEKRQYIQENGVNRRVGG
jgi:8-oxo-dGTP pyrophosphatase MutT (NUDIX family)/NTP pyrophosphatase (non-canonical NTP hydrolase)